MEAERNEILAIINTTHDVQLVKQLLLQHPTLCEWPQFRLSQQQQHCCIIRLLIEAGLRRNSECGYSIICTGAQNDDCFALGAFLRDGSRYLHPSRWVYAFATASESTLNYMTLFCDPAEAIRVKRDRMECYKVSWDGQRFHKPGGIDYHFFEVIPTLEEARCDVNEQDQPRYLRQYALLHPNIFDNFVLSDRYRRPATVDTLVKLGCPAVETVPHVCETLYDFSCIWQS